MTKKLIIPVLMLFALNTFWKSSFANLPHAKTTCAVDTEKILSNQSLPAFIQQIEQTKLKIYRKKKRIPPVIMDFLKCASAEEERKEIIANPKERWEEIDVIDRELANRQLVFVGISDSLILLTYYKSGMIRMGRVLLFKLDGQKITDFWSGIFYGEIQNLDQAFGNLKDNLNRKDELVVDYVDF